ncbi:hypothetical protein F8M41_017508 [Gigaspora margarita]|uniref:Uncharacterized protein n=1 Tax=Gigaspora margarita TaxID=4874 RepID=A0A8H4AN60_GIGMA|nr:hypothetical protein F8M41_017508 [Gigaspora margarita]
MNNIESYESKSGNKKNKFKRSCYLCLTEGKSTQIRKLIQIEPAKVKDSGNYYQNKIEIEPNKNKALSHYQKSVKMSDASSTYVEDCYKKGSSNKKLTDRIVNDYWAFNNYQKLSKLYTQVFDSSRNICFALEK